MGSRHFSWIILALMGSCAMVAGCTQRPVTEMQSFREAFALTPEDGWIVLSRPNSIWDVGTVLEYREKAVEDIGTVKELNCFPREYWIVETGGAPNSAYSKAIDYGLSLAATLGLPKAEVVKVGLNIAVEPGAETPTHKTAFTVAKATEKRVSFLKLEEYVENHFPSMSRSCKRVLLDPSRFLIDKIYRVEAGELTVVDKKGAKVNLGLPKYKVISDAAVDTGLKLTETGSLTVTQPVTFAVRAADFTGVLDQLGVATRAPTTATFAEVMRATGTSVPY